MTLDDGEGHGQQTWAAMREKFKEFARSDSRGACQDEQHANALRTGPRRVTLHYGQLP